MRRISSNSESGAILAIVIILMLALTITGIAFLNAGVMEYRLAKREDYKNKAFYIAEGGLERTLWNLKQHFKTDFESRWPTDGQWPFTVVNGIPVSSLDSNLWGIQYGVGGSLPGDLGGGSYEVQLEYMPGEDKIRIESTGTVKDIPRTVQIHVKAAMASPWNNAIFARKSAVGGAVILGNARIHGSVTILGEEGATDPVMDMGGTAGIRNNYDVGAPKGMPPDLAVKVPSIDKIVNGEWVETLDAALRVKYGKVGLQGEVTVGEEPLNNSIKRTMDKVHVPGEFVIGSGGIEDHVFTDNPDPHSASQLINAVTFPSLFLPYIDPATGDVFIDPDTHGPLAHLAYLKKYSLPISESKISSDDDFGSEGANPGEVIPGDSNDYGKIGWYFDPDEGPHGKVYLYVDGIVWIEAESLSIGEKLVPIEYSGTGVIVVAEEGLDAEGNPAITRNIEVHGDLLAAGKAEDGQGFPLGHALGLVTGTLGIAYPGEADLNLTGAFFAENAIHSGFTNEVAGTFVSNYFDMGGQVPRIYQVPKLATHVPPGMPGGPPVWALITSEWSES